MPLPTLRGPTVVEDEITRIVAAGDDADAAIDGIRRACNDALILNEHCKTAQTVGAARLALNVLSLLRRYENARV